VVRSNNDKKTVLIVTCLDPLSEGWRVIGRAILSRVKASRRILIVPRVTEMISRVNLGWEVVRESAYVERIPGLYYNEVRDRFGDRSGWYIQQFAKLGALIGEDYEVAAVWDADTLPLTDFSLGQRPASLVRFGSREFHEPYFSQIERCTGLKKKDRLSHIGQVMFVRRHWIDSFQEFVAQLNGMYWGSKLLSSISPEERYGFSEFEMLGTYFSYFHASEVGPMSTRWSRHGTRYFSHPRMADCFPWLGRIWFHLSFETWEKPLLFPKKAD